MSGGNALAVVMALLAGFAGAVQIAVLGRLGTRIGSIEAFAFSTLITAVLACLVLAVARQSLAGYGDGFRAPTWMWLAGVMGTLIVLSLTFAAPRIGATATIGVLIGSQLALGAVIDRFGLFGLDRLELHWQRLLGLALLAVGTALTLRYK